MNKFVHNYSNMSSFSVFGLVVLRQTISVILFRSLLAQFISDICHAYYFPFYVFATVLMVDNDYHNNRSFFSWFQIDMFF